MEAVPDMKHPVPCGKPIGCELEKDRQIACQIDDIMIDDGDACVHE